MNDDLMRRISAALDSDDGIAGDPELTRELAENPAAGRYAREVARVGRWLASAPLEVPDDDAFEALAQRIEMRLDDALADFPGDVLDTPIDDDPFRETPVREEPSVLARVDIRKTRRSSVTELRAARRRDPRSADDHAHDGPSGETLPSGETSLPSGETSLPSGETSLPSGETSLPSGEASLPSGETSLPSENVSGEVLPSSVTTSVGDAPTEEPPPQAHGESSPARTTESEDDGRLRIVPSAGREAVRAASPAASTIAAKANPPSRAPYGWLAIAAALIGAIGVGTWAIRAPDAAPTEVPSAAPAVAVSAPPLTSAVHGVAAVPAPAPPAPAAPAVQAAPAEPAAAPTASTSGADLPNELPELGGLLGASGASGGAGGPSFGASDEGAQALLERMEQSPARVAARPSAPAAEARGRAARVDDSVARLASSPPSAAPPVPPTGATVSASPLSRETVSSVMNDLLPAMQACAGDHHGTAQVDVIVDPSGRVTAANVAGEFRGTPEGSCMARAARTAAFPAFAGPAARFRYPYAL